MASDLSGRELGKYRLIDRVGEGGMGEVYRAFQSGLDRVVAIKVLRRLLQDDLFVQRFQREARSAGSLRHPHIIQVFDFGVEEGVYYMAMEYIAGSTLQKHLQVRGAIPLDETLHIVSQLADALDYAHTRGVIHRDIKPANVMFIDPDSDSVTPKRVQNVVLTDFGLARIKDDAALTTSGVFLGTPYYISPEAAQGHAVDGRADLYGLGVILFEMLTGVLPFNADTPTAVIMKHILSPVPSPRDLRHDLPNALEKLAMRALAKNPDERFQSAAALKMALDDARRALPDDLRAAPPLLHDTRLATMTPLILIPPAALTPPRADLTEIGRTLAVTPTPIDNAVTLPNGINTPFPLPNVSATPADGTPASGTARRTPASGTTRRTPSGGTASSGQTTELSAERETIRRANLSRRSVVQRRTTERAKRDRRRPRAGCLVALGVMAGAILMIILIVLALDDAPSAIIELPTMIARDMTESAGANSTSAPTATAGSFTMLQDAATAVSAAATDVAGIAATNVAAAQKALLDAAAAIIATSLVAPTRTPTPTPSATQTPTATLMPVELSPRDPGEEIAPAQSDELLILFALPESDAANDASRLLTALRTAFSDAGARYEIIDVQEIDADAAAALGARLNAALVVWILRTPTFNEVHFTLTADDSTGLVDSAANPFGYPFVFLFRVASNNADGRVSAQIVTFATQVTAGLTEIWYSDWDSAIARFEAARGIIEEIPRVVSNRISLAALDYALGFAYHQVFDYANAAEALDRALDDARQLEVPYADYARYYRGLTAYWLDDDQGAIDILRAANMDDLPEYYRGNGANYVGAALLELGEFADAIEAFDTALVYIPEEPYVYYLRGQAQAGLGDLSSAIADMTGAIVLNADLAEAYSTRGLYYEQSGLVNAAIDDYREYERITGQLEDWMIALIESVEDDSG